MIEKKPPRGKTCRLWDVGSWKKSWVGKRIEYSAYYNVDKEGKEKELHWVGGDILDVIDGLWLMPGARTKCYSENEAVYVFWDPTPEANCPACKSIEVFKENKWNKVCKGAWKKEDVVDYGI